MSHAEEQINAQTKAPAQARDTKTSPTSAANVAVGCGGIRRYDEHTGEIKRMYVKPELRRRGISRVVLEELEARARAIGYTELVLETGTRQPEAIALYESADYESIEPYGFYKDAPSSRCYAKSL